MNASLPSDPLDARPWLLVDLGNTRLKWTLAAGSRLVDQPEALAADPDALPWARWRQLRLAGIALASVAPASISAAISEALAARLGMAVCAARTGSVWQGLRCAYPRPERLGVDRWLSLIAVYRHDPECAAVVVSAGTALTVDRLDPPGWHRGGVIAPGLTAMRRGLFAAAPGLARFDDGRAGSGMATDSADAIASGCLQAALGLIERSRSTDDVRIWLSGGDAPMLAAHLRGEMIVRPWLVLEGLAIWAGAGCG